MKAVNCYVVLCILLVSALGAAGVRAQDFNLFEDVEASRNSDDDPDRRDRRNSARESRATVAEPVFTLVGTSRIGSQRRVILKDRNGESIMVQLQEQGNTPIPDHGNYAIVDHGAGNVSIQYPGNNPCAPFPDQGVSCNSAANIAALSLTTGDVVDKPQPVPEPSDAQQEAEENPDNPFAQLRARAAAGEEITRGDPGEAVRFQPRRIAPEDVPPGMRVVSTPFGDRLVQE